MKKAIWTVLLAGFLVGYLTTGAGCEATLSLNNLLNSDCFVTPAISAEEYDELPFWEKLEYHKNSCGVYVERDTDNTLDDITDWFD
ncbi:MAG: hypothetical protein GXY33_08030 [Phycisphaerae bacterium]|nr:hypothetical protein [Phycisphaerae bacterium]